MWEGPGKQNKGRERAEWGKDGDSDPLAILALFAFISESLQPPAVRVKGLKQ